MNYLKKTFEYLFILENGKRLVTLFLLSVPAGITMSFVAPTWAMHDWIKNYEVGNTGFWYNWNLGEAGTTFWIALLVLFVFMVVTASVLSSIISRSLRVGVFKVNRVFDEFNESFFPALYAMVAYLVIFLASKSIMALFLVLWQNLSWVSLSMSLSLATVILVIVGICLFCSLTLIYLPLMTFNGLKPLDAFVTSLQKCGRGVWKLFPSIIIPIALIVTIGNLFGLLQIPLLSFIIDSVCYSFLIAYFVTLTMISYYGIEQIKREDYPREYFFRNKR